jgi:hypothetical protein
MHKPTKYILGGCLAIGTLVSVGSLTIDGVVMIVWPKPIMRDVNGDGVADKVYPAKTFSGSNFNFTERVLYGKEIYSDGKPYTIYLPKELAR